MYFSVAKDFGLPSILKERAQWELLEKAQIFYFQQLSKAAGKIAETGIGLNAGHDLNLQNLAKIKKLKNLQEVSIGQAIVTESLEWGWKNTIQKYLQVLAE